MIASRYNISITDFPGMGKLLLYNTLTHAQVVINDELKSTIDALPAQPGKIESIAALTQLQRMGFVVAEANEDLKALETRFARLRDDDTVLQPTVLTTYSCNFGCVYCVEEGVKKPVFMDEKRALESVEYIKRKTKEYGSWKISLYLYGGEPLLNMAAVRTVVHGLHEFGQANGIPLSFGFNTNGALFTREIAEELNPFGLTWAKITLDGPKEMHDRKRPFKNGKGTFDLLMRNIEETVGLTNLDIGVNFDNENVGHLPALLDELAKRGLAAKIRKLVFNPITPSPKDREGLIPTTEMACDLLSVETARQKISLHRAALEKGFKVEVGVVPRMCEMLMKRTSFIIDPYGELYRCAGFAGRKEYRIGNLHGDNDDRFLGTELWRRCAECAYAPICGDGCPFGSFLRYGDPLALYCGKEATDYFVKESLKLSYLKKK